MAVGTKRGQSGDEVGTLLYDESEFNHSFIPFAPCHAPPPGRLELCRVTAHGAKFERKRAFPLEHITRPHFVNILIYVTITKYNYVTIT